MNAGGGGLRSCPMEHGTDPPKRPANAPQALGATLRRLFIAGLLSAAIAVVCWLVLPRAGVYVPWYVPVMAFAVIVVAALMRVAEIGGDDGDDEDDAPPDVAGRIGNEFDDQF